MTARQLEYPSSLNCCTTVHYLTIFPSRIVLRTFGIRKLVSSNPRRELVLAANVVLSEGVTP